MKRFAVVTALTLLAALCGARFAWSQAGFPTRAGAIWFWGPAVYNGWFGGYGYGGGTAYGNYLQGMSNVIRAQGQYNALSSQAGVNYEEARSRYLDNQQKWTENYYQMKEERQAYLEQKRQMLKHSDETLRAAAKAAAPRQLSYEALDPVTGQIHWPEALLGEEYAALRKELERQFELRAKAGPAGDRPQKIQTATAEMSALLRKSVQKLPANDYIAARKFLDSLEYAVQMGG